MERTIPKLGAFAALLILCVSGSAQANFQPRIVGGFGVDISVFPSTVAIIQNKGLGLTNPFYRSQICGGTLVGPTWVLTAAHCLFDEVGNPLLPSDISILAGTTDLLAPITSATPVSNIFTHPHYNVVFYRNDIALLQLSKPAPAPAIELNNARLPAFEQVFIAGWGTQTNLRKDGTGGRFPNILQGAVVPTQSASICATLSGNYQFVDANTQICAGFAAGGVDSCQGDSGGPLYNETKDGYLRLAGITSWGDRCALANKPSIYTDVVPYKDWIIETVRLTAPTSTLFPGTSMRAPGNHLSGGGGASMFFVPLLLLFYRFRFRPCPEFKL